MRALYAQLPISQKLLFVGWGCSVGGTEGQRYVQNLFSEKPYAAAFVCEKIDIQNFQDLALADGFGQFSDAVDNLLLYELDKAADWCYDDAINLIRFLNMRAPDTVMYKAGMKFVGILSMSKEFVHAEQEAMDSIPEGLEDAEEIVEDEMGLQSKMAKA